MSFYNFFKRSKNKSNCELIKKSKKTHQSNSDSGWGWIVVISSFIIQLVIDGTFSGYGVLYLSLRNDEAFISKNYSQTILSIPGTIQPGFFLCTGAFVSPLIRMFGFRISGCFGAFLLGLGMSVASYLDNIHIFTIFYGVISGSGFGILMVCAIVAVNYYFDRYRGMASGIAMSGAGIGTLSIPVFYNWIIHVKGWRSSLLIYSLTASLLTALASLTFKPFVTASLDNDVEQSGIIEDMKKYNPNQMSTVKNVPEIHCTDEHESELGDINSNKTSDMAIHLNSRLDDYTLHCTQDSIKEEIGGRNEQDKNISDHVNTQLNIDNYEKTSNDCSIKKDGKFSIGFANALRQYLLNQRESTALPENDSDAEDMESMIGSRLWKSSLGFRRSKPWYTNRQEQPSQSDQQRDYVKRSRRMTTATTTTIDPTVFDHIHSSYILSPIKKSRRKKLISQLSTPFDKPDAFYSASLASLNPRSSQILVAYKKSKVPSVYMNSNSMGLAYSHPSKPSLVYATELMSKKRSTTNDFISSNVSIQSFSTPLSNQHNEQEHDQQQQETMNSLDSQIYKSSRSNISPEFNVIEENIREEELITDNKIQGSTEPDYPASELVTPTSKRYLAVISEKTVKLFDLGLFTEASFLYLVGIGITSQLAYFIPYVYLIDCAISYGMEQNRAVFILMILSILHTIGRLISGIMANIFHMDSVYLSGLATLIGGLAHLFLVFILPPTFTWYALYASVYGLCSGIPIPLIPILLVRFNGLERLTTSFSNLNLLKGIASMIGPIVAISIVEKTGQKDYYFLVAGVCYVTSALLHLGLFRYPCSTQLNEENDDPYAKCYLFPNKLKSTQKT
ncbi:unnamed protein product [Heterobilharzia americana]|nr:unnamed protein product [Heterobilharzia americana]